MNIPSSTYLIRVLIHLSNTLFIPSNTLTNPSIKVVLTLAYLAFAIYDLRQARKTDEPPAADPRFSLLLGLIVAFLFFGFILYNGMRTLPNYDYHKYNFILKNINEDIWRPSLTVRGFTLPMAYYYAIFLPGVWLARLLGLVLTFDVYLMQLCFLFWFACLTFLLIKSLAEMEGSRPMLLLLFFFLVGGLDGLVFLITPGIEGSLIGQLQHGGTNSFFRPIRIQDMPNYLFWLPGHATAALVALRSFLEVRRAGETYLYSGFHLVAVILFLLSSSIFAFIAYSLFLALHGLMNARLLQAVLKRANWGAIVGLALVMYLMMQFYTDKKVTSGSLKLFLSPHIDQYGLGKYMLFLFQELFVFVLLGLAFRVRDPLYWLAIVYITAVTAFTSRDLMMSTSILLVAYMLFTLHARFDRQSRLALAALGLAMALYLPTLISNVGEVLDLTDFYEDNMAVEHAAREGRVVYTNYLRTH